LLDHLLEQNCILPGVIAGGSARRKLPMGPLAGRVVGDGSDVCGDLRGLSVDWRRTEHYRQPMIEAVIHPIVQRQADNQSSRYNESRTA
jgi:hypothetical protein